MRNALMPMLQHLPTAFFTLGLISTVCAEVYLPSTNYVIVAPKQSVLPLRQAQLEWSARVFETLMGMRPPRGRVVLTDSPTGSAVSAAGDAAALVNTVPLSPQPPAADGSVWNLSWYLSERGAGGRGPTFSALTHEAAHLQLIYTVNFDVSEKLKAAFNGYGSFLPDWLDEAVAVFHESDSLKLGRRIRFNPREIIPLKTFFTMSHPGTSESPQVIRIEAKTAEEARKKLAMFKSSQQPALQATAEALKSGGASVDLFYSQALAVIEYLIARGGLPFFRFVLVEQCDAKSFDEILVRWRATQRDIVRLRPGIEREAAKREPPPRWAAAGDPAGQPPPRVNKIAGVLVRPGEAVNSMPLSVDDMEADFVNWVSRNYPKYRPKLPPFPER